MIYLDNAATSFPKPEDVYKEIDRILREAGGNPGRGGHKKAIEAGRIIFEAREVASELLDIEDSSRFAFTKNGTEALNLAIKGCLSPGDHAVTTNIEHNSVTKPLKTMEVKGVEVSKVKARDNGFIDPKDIREAIKKDTKMVIMTYASNVIGTINPISDIGNECRKRGVIFLVDAAQTAGTIPLNIKDEMIDLLAAPGHKGLLGPQGTGLLYIREGIDVRPLIEGGTGEEIEYEEQPLEFPTRLESGTLNTPGIGGLAEGIRFILGRGIHNILKEEQELMRHLLDGLAELAQIRVIGSLNEKDRVGLVSFIVENRDPVEVENILDRDYGIMVRAGLHCAYDPHKAIGTFPEGTIRVSPGYFNTIQDIETFLKALREIVPKSRFSVI